MFRALLRYVPVGPLLLAVLLFVLMPFDREGRERGMPAQAPAVDGGKADFTGIKIRLPAESTVNWNRMYKGSAPLRSDTPGPRSS